MAWGATSGILYLLLLLTLEAKAAGILAPASVAISVFVYVTVRLGFAEDAGILRQFLGFAYLMSGVLLVVGVYSFVIIPGVS